MTTQPGNYSFTIYQYAIFNPVITWDDSSGNPVDLTGYTAAMQARTNVNATTAFIDLTTENGGITLGGIAGTISINMSGDMTGAVNNDGVYDLVLTSGSNVATRLLQGNIILSAGVTR